MSSVGATSRKWMDFQPGFPVYTINHNFFSNYVTEDYYD